MGLGRGRGLAGQLEVARDQGRIAAAHPHDRGHACVQKPSAGESRALLDQRPQPLVSEVELGVALDDQPPGRQLLQPAHDLVV